MRILPIDGNSYQQKLLQAVIPMRQQLNYFREYLARIELAVGRKQKDDIVQRAIFVVSAGTNDFIMNYNTYPFRRHEFSTEEYGSFLRERLWEFLQVCYPLQSFRLLLYWPLLSLVVTSND